MSAEDIDARLAAMGRRDPDFATYETRWLLDLCRRQREALRALLEEIEDPCRLARGSVCLSQPTRAKVRAALDGDGT